MFVFIVDMFAVTMKFVNNSPNSPDGTLPITLLKKSSVG